MNDTIAIFASARRNGNTGKFIDWIGNELDIDIIDLSEKIYLLTIMTTEILMTILYP